MKRTITNLVGAITLFALVLNIAAGCSSTRDTNSLDLEGTKWKLTGWTLSSLDTSDFNITAEFADGQISGNSGVNSYGGPYKSGPGNTFTVGQLAGTLMGGSEPAMRAEGAYTSLLGEIRSYRVTDSKLILYDKNGNESLIFESASE